MEDMQKVLNCTCSPCEKINLPSGETTDQSETEPPEDKTPGAPTEDSPCGICKKKCVTISVKNDRKTQKAKKKEAEQQFLREKADQFMKLKDRISVTQKNLADIQVQLQELEGLLLKDQEILNAPDPVLPPPPVPSPPVPSPPVPSPSQQPPPVPSPSPKEPPVQSPSPPVVPHKKTACICTTGPNVTPLQVSVKLNPPVRMSFKEEVSVLSAVPLDHQTFL